MYTYILLFQLRPKSIRTLLETLAPRLQACSLQLENARLLLQFAHSAVLSGYQSSPNSFKQVLTRFHLSSIQYCWCVVYLLVPISQG